MTEFTFFMCFYLSFFYCIHSSDLYMCFFIDFQVNRQVGTKAGMSGQEGFRTHMDAGSLADWQTKQVVRQTNGRSNGQADGQAEEH